MSINQLRSGVSSSLGKNTILNWINSYSTSIHSVMDIGVGKGTYYNLLNQTISADWYGIEIWKPYINEFKLQERYNKIYCEDARKFDWAQNNYDLTIMGDVIEHMTKEEAVELVNKILDNCKFCIISLPVCWYPQEAFDDNHYEQHIKDDWSHNEMLETFPDIKLAYVDNFIGVYLLSKKVDIPVNDFSEQKIVERNDRAINRVRSIRNLYSKVLKREADRTGLEYFYSSGMGIGYMTFLFLTCEEYNNIKQHNTNILFDLYNLHTQVDSTPEVSVVIPCFKNTHLVCETIDSLLKQSYKKYEIIVVNDGNEDILDSIMGIYKQLSFVTYVKHKKNMGVSASRNTAIKMSKGKYIIPLDSDDVINNEHWLKDLVEHADDNTIVTAPYIHCDMNMNPLGRIWPNESLPFDEIVNINILTTSSLFPKKLWETVGGYDESLKSCEDWDFWVGAYKHGYNLKHLKKPYINYRTNNAESLSVSVDTKKMIDLVAKKHNLSTSYDKMISYEIKL